MAVLSLGAEGAVGDGGVWALREDVSLVLQGDCTGIMEGIENTTLVTAKKCNGILSR